MVFDSRQAFLFLIILFSAGSSNGQQFGGHPPSVKWSQLNTPEVKVIFPRHLDSQAARIANIISNLNDPTLHTIGNKKKKIKIVLQNQTTISNGFVTLAPFHSEFFLTPLQNSFELGSIPWIETLAIHEFRHVQQFNNFDVGLSKLFHILFGESGQAFANNMAIPDWFFEGDAVYNETHLTSQGRGRLPFFHNPFQSLWKSGKNYSWMKLRNGSFKDYVPNHYALGYLLVAYGREKYGDAFWKNVTHDAASFKGLFYPFEKAIKKYAGKNYVQFRTDALNYFKNNNELPDVKTVKKPRTEVINEEYPAFVNDGSIVFVKSTFKKPHAFIIKDKNSEKRIRVKDVSLDNHFSYNNGKIVYASYKPDIRWGNRNYSDIKLLDIQTGKQRSVTHHTKYFAPDINADGTKVVAAEVKEDGRSSLKIISASDGRILLAVPNPDNLFHTYPKFYGDKIISAVKNGEGKMALVLIDPADGNTEYMTPLSFNIIAFPFPRHDTIYFSASQHKQDKVFAYVVNRKILYELELINPADGSGQYQPSVLGNRIVWTTFTSNGYRLQQSNISTAGWKVISPEQFKNALSLYEVNSLNKSNANLLATVTEKPLPVKKYSKLNGPVNFHSIIPGIDDPEYSVTLAGNNILNTIQTLASFTYNRSEKWKRFGGEMVYGGLFPYLSAGINYTIDRRGRYHGKTVYWNESEPQAGINFPFNVSKGRSLTFMNIGSRYVYNQSNFKGVYKDTLGKFSYSYLNNFFTINNQVQKALQNIYPAFAQSLSLNYKRALTSYSSSQFVANGNLIVRGLSVNHSIVLNGAWLRKDTAGQLNFSSGFPFSRGYQSENLHKMRKWGVNYHLPLFYPDAGVANIVYLLRLRTNLFYDHTNVKDFLSNQQPFEANFRSAGGELYFDTRWWNAADVTFGMRYSYLLDKDLFGATGKNRWEFILPVNLFDQ